MIHTGDCIDVMRGMEAESVNAVCTDPPYALAFMGKRWDAHPTPRAFMDWCTAWGTEALRVTKPGGYLLAFGGTRTHHRLVCGLEDAGWLIRDELDWIYASGFPKGRANLKPAHEPIVLARKPGKLRPLAIDECRVAAADGDTTARKRVPVDGAAPFGKGYEMGGDGSPLGRWPSNVLLSDPELFDEPNPYVVGSGAVMGPSAPASGPTWEGPSGSPSRSPFKGTDRDPQFYGDSGGYSRFFIVPKADRTDREPVLRTDRERIFGDGLSTETKSANPTPRHNVHPTVKPTDLMRHLVRLVTPPGGIVLDPFLGSGSTAIACELEGVDWVGIEKEPEYVAIAEARLNGTQRGLGLSVEAV